ncbi:MAG: c-type cytochrome domain-containing protein [Pirellulaceae bacterium]|nr:c-type cytochrome domain-containing protein [Pirellulaceae bacterium]
MTSPRLQPISRTEHCKFYRSAGIFLLCFLVGVCEADTTSKTTVGDESKSAVVDVRKDVWPIFIERCLHCHGPLKSDGDLRLDQKAFIDAGGHTGNPILGTEASSELLRRLVAKDDAYRMPKGEYPLSPKQIEILRRWIQQGASWPKNAKISIDAVPFSTENLLSSDFWNELLDRLVEYNQQLRILYWPLLLFLLLVAFLERRKQKKPISDERLLSLGILDRIQQRIGLPQYLIGMLCFLLASSIQLHRVSVFALRQKLEVLESKRRMIDAESPRTRFQVPTPYRPKHPPRLGGVYYRGNDERSTSLFNGGYYRTATMTVGLFDADDRQLQWNDVVENRDLFIQLVIERAPFATRDLFRSDMLAKSYLTRQIPNLDGIEMDDIDDHQANFETLGADERWRAKYPIAKASESDDKTHSALIYLVPGGNQVHYGIQYDIRLIDGKLSEQSEIWMGAIFLTGSVRVPDENEIPLGEWFDFLPIPEITDGNSEDPKLLGIEPR